jgi:outer membrane protein
VTLGLESGAIVRLTVPAGLAIPALMPNRSSSGARALATLASSLLSLGLLFAPAEAAAQSKLAVIDLRRAVADTEDGLRMKSKLQELLDTRQTELESKSVDFQKAKEELERLAREGKSSQVELQKKYASLEKQGIDLQNQELVVRREMDQKQNELMNPILDKLNRLVRQVASKEGYDLVVSRDAVPYVRTDLDITDRVIQMYNEANPAPAEAPKPTKPAATKPETGAPSATPAKPDEKPAPAKKPKPAKK